MAVNITKGNMWALIGDKAIGFAKWLASSDPIAAPIKIMLENTETIGIDSDLVQQQLLPYLLQQNVIDQAVIDRINAMIATDGGGTGSGGTGSHLRKWRVPIPQEISKNVAAVAAWLSDSGYVSGDIYLAVQDAVAMLDIPGACTAPGAEEVI